MNNSSTSDLSSTKERIKQRFTRLYKILLQGCGREYCFCSFCKNNPDFQFPNESAAAIALKNSTNNLPICEEKIIPKSLQAQEVNTFINEASDTAMYLSTLYKRVTEVFGSYESLNLSFLDTDDFKTTLNSKNPRIDFDASSRFFELVTKIEKTQSPEKNSLKSILSQSLKNALETFASEMKENRIAEVGQLRFIMLLFEIPEIFDFDFNSPFIHLLNLCLILPANLKQGLIEWFSTYKREKFAKIVENFSNIISIQIITNDEDTGYLKGLIMFTKILFEANKISHIISYEDFYVETISQEKEPKEEYLIWLENKYKNTNEFTYTDYPWILECEFKAKILDEESEYEMRKEIKNDMTRILASAPTGGMAFPSLDTILQIQNNVFYKIQVRRDNLLEGTLNQLSKTNINFKKPMKVKFQGEQGVDEGGVKKEFFQLITRQLFTPDYGMFTTKENDRFLWFNMNSIEAPLNFELAGMILGLAIYNSVNLDVKFPVVIYKKLLDEPLILKDVEEFDSDLYKSLKHILEYQGNLEEDLYMQFQVTYDFYGEHQVHELIPNGSNINVTQENKEEYVKLYLDWYLNKSIEVQFRPFYKGFNKVVTGDAIRLFTGEELLTLICGSPHLDFAQLEKVTTYEGGFTKDTPIIKQFWEVVHEFTEEQKKAFLSFCTGSDRAPIKGLGSMVFIIARHGPDSDILPSAHTCFNHLLLPEYSSKEKLREKLIIATSNAEGFGLF